jgi:hypothetical protein
VAPNVCDECDAAAGRSAKRELTDRSVAWWRLSRPRHTRRPGLKMRVRGLWSLLEEYSPLNEVGKDGGSWGVGWRYPASTSPDGGTSVDSAACGVGGSQPRDVRSDNDITGGPVSAAHSEGTP